MISNLNAPSDRPTDVYPFNVAPEPAPVHPTSYTLAGEGWTLHPPTPRDGDDYGYYGQPLHSDDYDTRPAPEREQADIEALRQEVKRLQTDVGTLSVAMLELLSRIEAMEYHR
jgi:hypothetical protein